MKRKFKIVGTVVSLGLCLAMLVIGVYAATSVSFDISASISFVVTDVFADIEGKVYLDAVASKGTTQVGSTWTSTSYSGKSPLAQLTNKTWNIGTTTFTSEKDCIVYTLKITNSANSGSVNVSVSTLPVAIDGTSLDCKYAIDGGASAQLSQDEIPVNAGEELLITITRTLTNKTKAIDSTLSWSPTVTIENAGLFSSMFKPTVIVSNENNFNLTIGAKETNALSTLPTETDYIVDAGSIDGIDGASIALNGTQLNATKKYYGFKLTVDSGTGLMNVSGDQVGEITGNGYKITWTYEFEDRFYDGKIPMIGEAFITCLIELTDFSQEIEILSTHLTLNLVIGRHSGGAD